MDTLGAPSQVWTLAVVSLPLGWRVSGLYRFHVRADRVVEPKRGASVMRFVIRKSKDGQFWFRINGDNGQTMANSELFTAKQSAESAIQTIRSEAENASVVDMTDTRFEAAERPP